MSKVLDYVDYPSPTTIEQALSHLASGGELWAEYTDFNQCPEHAEQEERCNCCYGVTSEDFEEKWCGEFFDANEDALKRLHLVKVGEIKTKYLVFQCISKAEGYLVEADNDKEAESKLAACDCDDNGVLIGVNVERYKDKDMTHDCFCQSEGVYE